MKINKSIARVLVSVMILSLILPNTKGYASEKVYKDETVYVTLDNKGKDVNKISSVWLHSESPLKNIEDDTILRDVVNVKSNEEPLIKNGKLVWETDKKEIYYQGEVSKELPIKTNVVYYLDGKEVDPETIAGDSGELKIEIDIQNTDRRSIKLKNGEDKLAYAPYMVATAIILPLNKFENVEMNTGKLISDGSNQILSFVSLPGLEESLNLDQDIIDLPNHLEIKADVVDFEMMPIVFTATSEIPEVEDLDVAEDLDELLDGIDSIVEASEKLNDATGKLYDGQGQLNGGINELVNGIDQIKLGTNPLLEGSKKLKNGIDSAQKGSVEINKGTETLSKSANQLGQGIKDLGSGVEQYSNKASEFSEGANKVAKGVGAIPEGTKALNAGMGKVMAGTESLQKGQDGLTEGLDKSLDALAQIKAGKEKEAKVISMLLKGLDGFDGIVGALENMPGGEKLAGPLKEGLAKQRMALEGLEGSSAQLISGLSELEAGLKEAEGASKALSAGIKEVNAGQKEVGNGLNELGKGATELEAASKKLEEGSIGLKNGAAVLNENAVKAKQGSDKFAKGGRELSKGANSLSNGLGELSGGSSQLNNGISELSKGSNELSQGGNQLKDGSQKLVDGSKELDEGMSEFYESGIKKMSDEVNNSDLDIEGTLEIKDELVKIGKENNSFTGISEDMDGTLKFIMKTEAIKSEVEKEKLDIEEEAEDEKGFINWIKGLFK